MKKYHLSLIILLALMLGCKERLRTFRIEDYPTKTFIIGVQDVYWTGPHGNGYGFIYLGIKEFGTVFNLNEVHYSIKTKIVTRGSEGADGGVCK